MASPPLYSTVLTTVTRFSSLRRDETCPRNNSTRLPEICHWGFSYPEGNFGRNQLLGDSMSLSPLHQTQTNELHVSIATSNHRSFPRLSCFLE